MSALFSCSVGVVACWGICIVLSLILWGQQAKSFSSDNKILVVLGGTLVVVSAIAFLLIIFGMAIHCLLNGDLSIGTKTLWSIFAFLTAPFGASIYFFAVYKKQRKTHREDING
jgi:multisubunit Na+/H+ antiporter MnhG subunit